jgi:cell fate regulator YaaT (PSP1 superfamily)
MDMPANYKPFHIVEVKFKGSRKEFYLNHENLYIEAGELVAVETAIGGYDIGHVSLTGELVRMQLKKRRVNMEDVTKKIYRKATSIDIDKWQQAKGMEFETMHKARVLAKNLGLAMKLSDVDYQGDKTKATFYYTAEGRVDFRELIKRMAETFRIRIEMRQVGMRQEASRLGGIGSCGRELCCSTWLTDFKTVSTSAARYQNLSLNTLKLAGQCGKLKCCLNYELDTYMDALKDIPDHADRLETEKGIAKLQKTDIFKKLMWFSYANAEEWIPLQIDRVKYVQQLNKKGIKPPDLKEEVLEVNKTPIAKAPDYENVVGQDSLTRLDDKTPRKRANQKRNKKPKNASTAPAVASPHPVQTIVKSPEPKQAEVASTDDIPSGNRNNNRRKNRSNKNRPKPTV